jgi:molybdopterin synthase catalytic subunit
MANPVCEVLITEERLTMPEERFDRDAGARVDFHGIVRGLEGGREIDGIDYEAHRDMAAHQLKRIAEQAAVEFGLRSIVIYHRIGFVRVGEPSLLTRVCSGHRDAAFRGSGWIVEELKKKVPIWKRPRFKVKPLRLASRSEAATA